MWFFNFKDSFSEKGEGKRIREEATGRKGRIIVPFPLTFNNILRSILFNLWHSLDHFSANSARLFHVGVN